MSFSHLHQSFFILPLVLTLPCMPFTASFTGGPNKLLDLTHDLEEMDNSVSRSLKVSIISNYTMPGRPGWYINEEITTPVHFGTHIDAPCYAYKELWCVDAIPLDRLILPAILVDISSKVNGNPNVQLTSLDLINWEAIYGRIPDGSLLLVRTDWCQFWSNYTKYKGSFYKRSNYPSIMPEAAQWLVNYRNIYGIGIDSFSLDDCTSFSTNCDSHYHLFSHGIYGIEELDCMHLVPPTGSIAYVMPMKLKGMTGAPCRVVLKLP